MERSWLRRIALVWGGLALAAQLWVSFVFIRWLVRGWQAMQPQLVSFAESADRFSQLKTPALKYPAILVYVILFVAGIAGIVGWMTIRGAREAWTAKLEVDEPDQAA